MCSVRISVLQPFALVMAFHSAVSCRLLSKVVLQLYVVRRCLAPAGLIPTAFRARPGSRSAELVGHGIECGARVDMRSVVARIDRSRGASRSWCSDLAKVEGKDKLVRALGK